ncbi:MAG: DnaJ domain-containing protein, partial [Polyangia bacterium]
ASPPPKGMRYGAWLVEKQLVSVEHMRLALKAQVRRKLHRLFFLNEGQFSFQAGPHQEGMEHDEPLRVHPARAIYQGVRSAWNADRLKQALFLLDGRAIKCTLDSDAIARYGVGTEDGRVAELLRKGYWTLPDLVSASGLPLQPVHALVYTLYVTDALEIRNADEVPRLRRRAESGSSPLPGAPPAAPLEPSGARPLPPRESSGARPLPPPLEPSGARPLPPRESSGARPLPPGDPASLRAQVEAKARTVESENLFAVLELPESAGRDQVKQAYFDAAKRYHPDRLASLGLEALRPEVEKIFRRVSEAYSTLFDDAKREAYRKTLASPEAAPTEAHLKAMKLLEAEMAFKRGEVHLRKNDFPAAIRELEQAVAGNPQEGEHLAWLTWAKVCARELTWADAKPRLVEATRLSPRCARAFYFLGLCYKEDQDIDRAYNMFGKAHELDARLLDAEREMRLINMRREKTGTKGGSKGGLFDRFRKK